MSYSVDKLEVGIHTHTHTHMDTQTDTGNDITKRPNWPWLKRMLTTSSPDILKAVQVTALKVYSDEEAVCIMTFLPSVYL